MEREIAAYRLEQITEMPRCPECGSEVDRPKCFYELGSYCPRHEVEDGYGGRSALMKKFDPERHRQVYKHLYKE